MPSKQDQGNKAPCVGSGKPSAREQLARTTPGFGICALRGAEQSADQSAPNAEGRRAPAGVTLFAGDQYAALAAGDVVEMFELRELLRGATEPEPLFAVRMRDCVVQLQARGGRGRELLAALADGSLWALRLPEKARRLGPAGQGRVEPHAEPALRWLAEGLDGRITAVVGTRSKVYAVTRSRAGALPALVEIDPARGGITRSAGLPFARVSSLTAFDADRGEALLVVDAAHEAHLVTFSRTTDAATLEVTPFEGVSRVTAATVLDGRWMVVARKGGELRKVAMPTTGVDPATALRRACHVLAALLRACGCAAPCDCREKPRDCSPCGPDGKRPGNGGGPTGGSGGTRPGGTRPGEGRPSVDDEPCDEKQQAELGWSVGLLAPLGRLLLAVSARGDRLAVLDRRLQIVFERYLGPRGAHVAAGSATTDKMLIQRSGTNQLEVWSLGDYVATLPGFDRGPKVGSTAAPASSVVFYGRKHRPATANPHLRVAVFTVTEPGQAFNDPDQAKLAMQLQPNVFDEVIDYYWENSYQTLIPEFRIFGVHLGTARKPLVLPRAIASYFYDSFTPGGVEAVMPAHWANPVVLDGRESLALRSHPAVGVERTYDIEFAALWTTSTHAAYPVVVAFSGTEKLDITVTDQAGTSRVLHLQFGALNLSHAQGDDEAAFLAALAAHVTAAVRAAEATLPGAPVTLQDVVYRRVRTSDNDAEFGTLQGQLRLGPPPSGSATQKGTVALAVPAAPSAGLTALGLHTGGGVSGVLGSASQLVDYWSQCLTSTQSDAGEGPGLNDPHFSRTVLVTEDVAAQDATVRIELSREKGGSGATLEVVAHSGLGSTGWDASMPVPGSESNANKSNTMRHFRDLANDVFTAAMDHIRATSVWDADNVRAQFADFDAMMIGFVGACPAAVPAADRWNSSNAVDFGRLRMFVRYHTATDLNHPGPGSPVTMGTSLLIGQRFNQFDPAVMSHEIGHGLGLPDLYGATGFRDDIAYIDRWCQMAGGNGRFNHFCGWSKWAVGWIADDGNPDLNRIIDVPMPAASGVTATEAWLVPIEHWDAAMKVAVEAEVGAALPIGQLMRIHLGSDGGVVDLVELRSRGVSYSRSLPPTPAVIVTNVLQPGTDRRWAVNGLYRRNVHLLHDGSGLQVAGDKWDAAGAPEFPVKGCTIEVVETRSIRPGTIPGDGGSPSQPIPVFRIRIERQAAEFIDLHFQDNVPSWRSPDIWVDWIGDNADPTAPRIYPEGTPTDQGEVVRFPSTGTEPHFLVTRVHNAGNVRAENVKVRWFVCDPPGAGDDGRWMERDTQTLASIDAGAWEVVPFTWSVTSSTNAHQCLRAEIIDWTIPAEVDPTTGDTLALGSDDVLLQNNLAQKNVFDFEAASGSPFVPITFEFQVHNDAVVTETAYLCPERLPWGATLEISPAQADIPPGEAVIFTGKLTLDDTIIRPGCTNDQGFLLTAWRVAEDADERWGSCFYHLRPRLKTTLEIVRGFWYEQDLSIHGLLKVVSDQGATVASQLPLSVRVRVEFEASDAPPVWTTAAVDANGMFRVRRQDVGGPSQAIAWVQAWFERTALLASSRSAVFKIHHEVEPIIH